MGYKLILSIVLVSIAYIIGNNYHYFTSTVKSPVVEIISGKLQGRVSVSRDGRDYFEYLGVPYAKPPIGELRYEPPEPFTEKWDGERDATSLGSECIQVDNLMKKIVGNENCLFANIHTPNLSANAKFPVMVWFHGGLFTYGSGNMYRPEYFMDEDVVLVTVNYRLSSFGFLNTGDGLIKGNMGLKDQNMALRFIKENIQNFGGNPNDVIIFGESAGGASTHFHMLSPMSKGLFQKAISQSGLGTMPWAICPHPARQAKRFAQQLKCPTGSTQEMIKCLRNRDAMELVSVHSEYADNLGPTIAIFLPTIEIDMNDGKSFLVEMPRDIIDSGNFNKVPFLTGLNGAEGLLRSAPIVANRTTVSRLINDWAKTLGPMMMMQEDVPLAVFEQIKEHYMNGENLDLDNPMHHIEHLTNIFGDFWFNLGFHNGMISHSKVITPSAPLFIYYYTYQGEFGLDQIFLSIKGVYHPLIEILWTKVTNWFKTNLFGQIIPRFGACHGDELGMEFYVPYLASVPKGSRDYDFSKKIINVIIQFVKLDTKSSKPITLEFMGKTWTPQQPNKPLQYMILDLNPKMIPEPFQKRISFWHPLNLVK